MQVTFTYDTPADLEKQLSAFITDGAVQNEYGAKRPLPSWAPAGASWVLLPGAPALQGPDGQPIPITWVGSVPVKGTAVHNPDTSGDAASAALLASIRG